MAQERLGDSLGVVWVGLGDASSVDGRLGSEQLGIDPGVDDSGLQAAWASFGPECDRIGALAVVWSVAFGCLGGHFFVFGGSEAGLRGGWDQETDRVFDWSGLVCLDLWDAIYFVAGIFWIGRGLGRMFDRLGFGFGILESRVVGKGAQVLLVSLERRGLALGVGRGACVVGLGFPALPVAERSGLG